MTYSSYWNSLWSNAYSSGITTTTINASNTTYVAPTTITNQDIVINGSNDMVYSNAAILVVQAEGNHDSTTTSSLNVTFVSEGSSNSLTLTAAGANVIVDLTNADNGACNATTIYASNDIAVLQDTCYSYNYSCCCSGSGVPYLNIVGDYDKVRLGNYSVVLGVAGILDIVLGGCASSIVNMAAAAQANVIVGGSGYMTVNSAGDGTAVIGGCGTMSLNLTGSDVNVVGGRGDMYGTINSANAAIQTGGGQTCLTLHGANVTVVSGAGSSVINYSDAVGGGLFYEGRSAGYAEFNVCANNTAIYGGDVIRAVGTNITIKSQAAARTDQGGSVLARLQSTAAGVYAALLPDSDLRAALQAANPVFMPDGVAATTSSGCTPYVCQPCYRTIDFRVESGSVFSDSRAMFVTVNGSNNDLYGGTVGQIYWIQSGEFNAYYAGAGNNVIYGDCGRNVLEYIDSPGPVTVNFACGYAINGYGGVDQLWGLSWAEAGSNATLIGGQQSATLTVYGTNSTLQGGCGSDVLTAFGSGNRLYTGNGSDLLHTTGTDNAYIVGQTGSIPALTVINQEAVGVTGTLNFLSCVQPSQLWFKTDTAGDLVIGVLGTCKQVIVDNWFSSNHQLASITAGGKTISNASINTLEGAMVNYQSSHASFDPTRATALPSDSAISAAYAGWH